MLKESANAESPYVPRTVFGRLAEGILNKKRIATLSVFGVMLISIQPTIGFCSIALSYVSQII